MQNVVLVQNGWYYHDTKIYGFGWHIEFSSEGIPMFCVRSEGYVTSSYKHNYVKMVNFIAKAQISIKILAFAGSIFLPADKCENSKLYDTWYLDILDSISTNCLSFDSKERYVTRQFSRIVKFPSVVHADVHKKLWVRGTRWLQQKGLNISGVPGLFRSV